jgi:hypothetical protein
MGASDPDRPILIKAVVYSTLVFVVLGALVGFRLVAQHDLGILALLGIVVISGAIGAGAGFTVVSLSNLFAGGLIRSLFSAGNIAPAPSFSYQESLVARGRLADAADAYREHLTLHPADHDARLALAALLAGPVAEPAQAERLLLQVRAEQPSPRQELIASQSLIDLYAATGQRGRHLVELARFADRHRGTVAGEAAREAVKRMKDG